MGLLRRVLNSFRPRKVIREELDAAMNRWLRDIDFGLRLRAILASADFVYENIPLHLRFTSTELRKMALDAAPREGLLLEFGVWQGGSINQFAGWTTRPIYGFDSFEGLPEPWSIARRGHFAIEGLPAVRDNVTLVKGWFNETLPKFLAEHPEPVAFVHMDCDLYSSTATVLELLKDRLLPGATIVLDDFLMEPGWQREEHKAWLDLVASHQVAFKYLGYQTGLACAAAVQIQSISRGAGAA